MAANGMLSGLFGPTFKDQRQEGLDEDARLQNLATMGPFRAAAYTAYSGAQQAGKGLGQAVGGALGVDTRTPIEKNIAAIQAAKDQVSKLGFNPDDPKSVDQFYTQVIQILQRQGLVAEAADVAREWHTQKLGDQRIDLQNRDLARKEKADDALTAYRAANLKILQQKGIPEFQKYLNEIETTSDPFTRKMLTERVNQMLGKSGKGVIVKDAGDHLAIVDAASGAILGSEDVGAKPMNEKDQQKLASNKAAAQNAYRSMKSGLQHDYDAAVQLYNHPGLPDAVGPIAGQVWVKGPEGWWGITNYSRLSPGGRDAGAEIQQLAGSVFIQALQDLKSQSKTGASGLGQLTEIEGSKIQNAKGAIDPHQDYASFRNHLAQYIQSLADKAAQVDQAARNSGIEADVPFQPKQLSAKAGRYQAPVAKDQVIAPRDLPSSAPPDTDGLVYKGYRFPNADALNKFKAAGG